MIGGVRAWLELTHRRFGRVPRYENFGQLQEAFLVSAVATILVIRTQLWLTNYPQLGGGGLHIAHLLYGGFIMAAAIGLLLTYLGRWPRMPAAVLGGVGFGFFIDELGKFITADNDYFYKPAASLIYIVFVSLFLVTRSLRTRRGLGPAEKVANAAELLLEAVQHDLDVHERARALRLLSEADPRDPLVARLKELLGELEARPAGPPSVPRRAVNRVRSRFWSLSSRPDFPRLLAALLVLWATAGVLRTGNLILPIESLLRGEGLAGLDISFVGIAMAASTCVSAGLVGLGLSRLRRGSRARGYRPFERALFVSIFVTEVFAFAESQFAAVFGLGIDIVLLVAVRSVATGDREVSRASLGAEGGVSAPPSPA